MKKFLKIILFPITFPIFLLKKIFKKNKKRTSFNEFIENIKCLKGLKINFKATYSDENEKYDVDYKNEKKGA